MNVILYEKLHLQRSEIMAMPYYEYETTIEEYNEILKERKKKEDSNKSDMDQKTPKLPNYKMPKMPNIKIPKY